MRNIMPPAPLAIVAGLLLLAGCAQPKPDTLEANAAFQREVDLAVERARSDLPRFIEALEANSGQDFTVRAPIRDGDKLEHCWIIHVTLNDDEFTGTIPDVPQVVTNVKQGQTWKIKTTEISDWKYLKDGKLHGYYSLRPILATLPKSEADMYRSRLAEP